MATNDNDLLARINRYRARRAAEVVAAQNAAEEEEGEGLLSNVAHFARGGLKGAVDTTLGVVEQAGRLGGMLDEKLGTHTGDRPGLLSEAVARLRAGNRRLLEQGGTTAADDVGELIGSLVGMGSVYRRAGQAASGLLNSARVARAAEGTGRAARVARGAKRLGETTSFRGSRAREIAAGAPITVALDAPSQEQSTAYNLGAILDDTEYGDPIGEALLEASKTMPGRIATGLATDIAGDVLLSGAIEKGGKLLRRRQPRLAADAPDVPLSVEPEGVERIMGDRPRQGGYAGDAPVVVGREEEGDILDALRGEAPVNDVWGGPARSVLDLYDRSPTDPLDVIRQNEIDLEIDRTIAERASRRAGRETANERIEEAYLEGREGPGSLVWDPETMPSMIRPAGGGLVRGRRLSPDPDMPATLDEIDRASAMSPGEVALERPGPLVDQPVTQETLLSRSIDLTATPREAPLGRGSANIVDVGPGFTRLSRPGAPGETDFAAPVGLTSGMERRVEPEARPETVESEPFSWAGTVPESARSSALPERPVVDDAPASPEAVETRPAEPTGDPFLEDLERIDRASRDEGDSSYTQVLERVDDAGGTNAPEPVVEVSPQEIEAPGATLVAEGGTPMYAVLDRLGNKIVSGPLEEMQAYVAEDDAATEIVRLGSEGQPTGEAVNVAPTRQDLPDNEPKTEAPSPHTEDAHPARTPVGGQIGLGERMYIRTPKGFREVGKTGRPKGKTLTMADIERRYVELNDPLYREHRERARAHTSALVLQEKAMSLQRRALELKGSGDAAENIANTEVRAYLDEMAARGITLPDMDDMVAEVGEQAAKKLLEANRKRANTVAGVGLSAALFNPATLSATTGAAAGAASAEEGEDRGGAALAGAALAAGIGAGVLVKTGVAGRVVNGINLSGIKGEGADAVRSFLKRNFTSTGDLPPEVFSSKIRNHGWIESQVKGVNHRIRDFNAAAKEAYGGVEKMTDEEIAAVDRALKGAGIEQVPEAMRGVVTEMRNDIDALSRKLIEEGVVQGPLAASIESNLGFYAKRSYRIFDDPQWAKKVPADVKNRAIAYLRSEYPDAPEEEIQGIVAELLFKAEDGPIAMIQKRRLGSKAMKTLTQRKEIHPSIRALWGEYGEAQVNYAKSVGSMAQLVGNHRILMDARRAGLGRFFFEKPIVRDGQEYAVQIAADGSKAMAPLNGLYTTPEIRDAFEQAFDNPASGTFLRMYMKANGVVKIAKAQPLDATVWTPGGPRAMGSLSVGDLVCGVSGPTRVTGIFPQGERQVFRVGFADGSSTEATADHLWEVIGPYGRKKYTGVFATAEIASWPEKIRRDCSVPLGVAHFDRRKVPVDPYLLGALLGDGSMRSTTLRFTTADTEMLELVGRALPEDHEIRHPASWAPCDYSICMTKHYAQMVKPQLAQLLKNVGVWGKLAHEKSIPALYRHNSRKVRLAVLQGLLDTDGTVDKDGQPVFTTVSRQLAEDVREVAESLGATVLWYEPKPVEGGRQPYTLRFRVPNAKEWFRLKRKKDRASSRKKPVRRMFRTIEHVGAKLCQCIKVADERELYLTDRFIVTHNTVFSPQAQVRNFIGNTGFAIANGHMRASKMAESFKTVLYDLGAIDKTSEVKRSLTGQPLDFDAEKFRQKYRRLLELGVVSSGTVEGELRDLIRDATKNGLSHLGNPIVSAANRGVELSMNTYRASDDLWKIYAFENEITRYKQAFPDMEPAELEKRAAEIVRNTYPNYEMVPNAVKMLRRIPLVGTFVSFPAEVLRVGYNTLRQVKMELDDPATRDIGMQRAAGVMAAAGMTYALTAATRQLVGVTPEEEDDMRRFLPPWSKHAQFYHLGKDEKGNYRFVNMGYTDPYSYLKEPVMALLSDEDWETKLADTAWMMLEPFFGEELLAGRLIDVARNKRKDTGAKVYNEQLDLPDRLGEQMMYVAEAFEPGVLTSGKRILKGYTGETTESGRVYDFEDELKAVATGMRREALDVRQSLRFRSRDYQKGLTEANRIINSTLSNRGTVDSDDIREAYEDTEAARERLFREMHDDAWAAIRMGMTKREVYEMMRQSGVSEEQAKRVIQGVYEPYRPSKAFLQSLRKSTILAASDRTQAQEGRRQLAERVQTMRRLYSERRLTPREQENR